MKENAGTFPGTCRGLKFDPGDKGATPLTVVKHNNREKPIVLPQMTPSDETSGAARRRPYIDETFQQRIRPYIEILNDDEAKQYF
ncbi:MAG: hypothetical protein MJ102_08730, partial [Clostridia bacterium]|nr:hypothetical protein [Clostridia bacterium]